ncbi:MAG: quinolinate synthase NadA, partial [Planctomycetaceae bacterium]
MSVNLLKDYENIHIEERQSLPDSYLGLSEDEMRGRIAAARDGLGQRLLILGHHYQRDEVIEFADYTGDSFKLSRQAAAQRDAEYIVFCGVHFMAESADVLSDQDQKVVLPDLAAGCSMADMAAPDQLEVCWSELGTMGACRVIPVTYINSAASIKAFCGERDGVVCTSSNADATLKWAWERGDQILFLPDQHLGRNTAYAMGVPLDQMVVWDPDVPFGGVDPEALKRARMILWKGHCSVHTKFNVEQVNSVRQRHPSVRVIVHPECTWDVVQAADDSGSTEHIIRQISDSVEGSVWAVGTEVHLVSRLAETLAPDRTVLTLDPIGCLCSTMFR